MVKTKSRNRLELEKVELLLLKKVGLNLKFLHEANKAVKKQLNLYHIHRPRIHAFNIQ